MPLTTAPWGLSASSGWVMAVIVGVLAAVAEAVVVAVETAVFLLEVAVAAAREGGTEAECTCGSAPDFRVDEGGMGGIELRSSS